MKKYVLPVVVLLLCIMFTACNSDSTGNTCVDSHRNTCVNSHLIGDEVTKVEITHILAGRSTERNVEGDDIEALRLWANELEYELREFEEGNTPGDGEGQEVYWFELNDGSIPGFDYVICGPTDCYLLMGGSWYAVGNPSDPDFFDETLKNKLIYGAAHDPNADNSEYAVTGAGQPFDD